MDERWIACMICPESGQAFDPAPTALLEDLNDRIAAGNLKDRKGLAVARRLDGGLVRQDGRYLYPVVEGIPVLIVDESIPLKGDE